MQVKCALCDQEDELDDSSYQAKRLRNRRIGIYICDECYERISNKTKQRHLTGEFHLYKSSSQDDEYI